MLGMPNRNTVRAFQPQAIYHVYNRGVAKQSIFLDDQDYRAFIRRLELLLLPEDEAERLQHTTNRIRLQNLHSQVELQAFCLMPNHFHLMIKQGDDARAITRSMRTLSTSYSMYFNKKYNRIGPIFQGRYKASWVNNEPYMLHLSRYIHCNPLALKKDIYAYPFSSLQYYFQESCPKWVEPGDIESLFSSQFEYEEFVDDLIDIDREAQDYEL